MHDKNGVEIREGSFVKHTTYVNNEQVVLVSRVIRTKPGTDSCNVYLGVSYPALAIREEYASAKDVEVVA